MRSAQSARIASTTVALFNRFNTISSFRLFSVNSVVSKGEAFAPVGRAPNRSSPLQTSQTAFKSFSLLSYQSIDRNLLVRRHLSTSGEIEDKNQKSSSFSVPAMGTGIDNDGSIATNDYTGYEKWVRRLYATNMFHPVKLGLENMHLLHKLLGNPMDDPNRIVVHVAGTNGKGSVCLKIANALRNQQRRSASPNSSEEEDNDKNNDKKLNVGIFCSPHVSSFRERMQVNGEMITEEEVTELLPQIYELCLPENNDIPATFFEITTALAFLFFAKRQTDVVVLETGLGGRLDATNVIANPALSIITSIGLEHTNILGDTIELIAREKAGIIKKDCPVLVGPHCPHEVIMECARQKSAGRYYTPSLIEGNLQDFAHNTKIFDESSNEGPADYDIENQEIAKAALSLLKRSHPDMFGKDLTADEIEDFTSIRPPCRFETFQTNNSVVILDVAHNPSAMEYLVYKLKTTYPEASFRFVAGMSRDKDLGQCARALLSATNGSSRNIHLVQAAHPRAATLESIIEAESSLETAAYYDFENRSITKQVLRALDMTKENDDEILVVCGSVFLMAETREALGIDEPRDSDYITEMAGSGIRHGQENFGNTKM
jgi:dihydrofolate synthase/folylpolyglutamate synthase